MRSGNDRKLGLYTKFIVAREDGSSGRGGKHENCEYFVLDLVHDQFAPAALRAYADACAAEFPKLAEDLRAKAAAGEKNPRRTPLEDALEALDEAACSLETASRWNKKQDPDAPTGTWEEFRAWAASRARVAREALK